MNVAKINNIPVYEAKITDEETGMLRISLVDDPAVMKDFLAFDKTKQMLMYKVEDEEKRLVRGVVMRADFPIFRTSEESGDFYIIYKADQIRIMAEKYLAEARQNEVNTMHEEGSEVEGVQMVQYFIKDTENGINPAGFEDITDGSLFAEFHILNDEVWEAIKGGTYKGFSLEGIFNLDPILQQGQTEINDIVNSLDGAFSLILNNFKRSKEMSKMKRVKQALASILAAFASIATDKGVLVWDGDEDIKVGDAVKLEDSEGNHTTPADGDYKTDDGTIIVVKDGAVEEIKEENEESEEEDAEVVEARMEAVKKTMQKFSESYDELQELIANAILASGKLPYQEEDYEADNYGYGWLIEAGDDFGIWGYSINSDNWGSHTVRFPIKLNEDGTVEVGDFEEVKQIYVRKDFDYDWNEGKPATSNEEAAELKKQVAELKKQVAKLRAKPFAKPAHEEARQSVKFEKTGDIGLDNLGKLLMK